MAFTGIPPEALDFYARLEADNSKVFWEANKSVYRDEVKAPVQALCDELGEYGPFHLFRPYNDVRFAKNRPPYKTQQGAYGEGEGGAGYYFHISREGLLAAAGYYAMMRDQLERFRAAVDAEHTGGSSPTIVAGLVEALPRRRHRRAEDGAQGLPKDHPRIDLLRRKGLMMSLRPRRADSGCTPSRLPQQGPRGLVGGGADERLARRPCRAHRRSNPTDASADGAVRAFDTLSIVTVTDSHRAALENQFGLADRVVDADSLARSVDRFRERGITLPTFTELADPSTFDHAGKVGNADPQGPDARNLWRVHWYNDLAGGRVDVPQHVVLPPELTGVDSPIIVVFGDRFPMITAHKVLAAYACLAPRIVTGQFDPTRHRAIWPSTGNYARGGIAI